jgi:protein subunit release factor A
MELTLEIRAAEGGDDAKLLVAEQASIYQNYAKRKGLAVAAASGKG